jgi:hypothetical protein
MTSIRRTTAAALAASAALSVGVPAASARSAATPAGPLTSQLLPGFGGWPGGANGSASISGACGTSTGPHGQGATGGTAAQICSGAGGGLSFVGPAIGQVATVIGPTIIGPGVIGNVVVSAGNGFIG